MKKYRVSRRYAQALFNLASEMKIAEKVAADMRLIHDSITASKELRLFFESPVVDRDKKRNVVNALFAGNVDTITLHFLLLLIDKGRENVIDGITEEFAAIVDDALGIVHAELKAPFELDKGNESDILSRLEDLTKKKIHVSFSLDKSLVGGFVAQIGDTVYDGSVRRQLDILKQQLS